MSKDQFLVEAFVIIHKSKVKLGIRGVQKQLKTFLAANLEAPTSKTSASVLPAILIAWDDGIARHSAQFFRGFGLNA